MHGQQPPGVVQNWSTLQCNKQNTEQCGYDHAPVTRGRMRAQFPLPHGPPFLPPLPPSLPPCHFPSCVMRLGGVCLFFFFRFSFIVECFPACQLTKVRTPKKK